MILLICVLLATQHSNHYSANLAERSGRALLLSESDSQRLHPAPSVPPGIPPVLSFRFMDGARKHRFADSDLMVDDAGH